MIAAPRGVMNIEVTGSPALSVGEPLSVPSRISVVLVEEVNSGDTPCLECPHKNINIRLLAGEAKPASVTGCEDDLRSPCVGGYGTLSPSDSDPAGLAGPYDAGGPVGPDGTISPFFSDPAWPRDFAGGPFSVFVRLRRVVAFTAAHGLNATCIGMRRIFTWTWHNCGCVWCLGAQCGKARHKIVWIMFGGRMMFRGTLIRPALKRFFRRGQSDVRCGRIP